MDELGVAHTLLALLALVLGLVVLSRRKGTPIHRTVGHLYVSSMIGVNVTALSIYGLFGGFGPFHMLAAVSLATILAGMIPVVLRRPAGAWAEMHAKFMSWSYVGLVAAAAAELVVRVPWWRGAASDVAAGVPGWRFAVAVTVATTLVSGIGAIIIHGRSGVVIRRALRRAAVPLLVVSLLVAPVSRADAQGVPGREVPTAPDSATLDAVRSAIDTAVSAGSVPELRRIGERLASLQAIDPSNPWLLHYRGYLLYRQSTMSRRNRGQNPERLQEAEELLERSAAVLPLAESHALLSSVVGLGIGRNPATAILRARRANRSMDRAVEIGVDNPRVALLRGISAMHTPSAFGGGILRAQAHLERAISLFAADAPRPPLPSWGHAEAHAWLGRVLEETGHPVRAREAYLRALEIDPAYVWVSEVLLPKLENPRRE